MNLMEDHTELKAHGYVVSPDRDDYRVSIEGLQYSGEVSAELMVEFVELCRYADEFSATLSGLYCRFSDL